MGFSKTVKFFAIFYTLFFALPTYALEGRGEKIYNRMLNEFVIEVNQKHGLKYMGGGGAMKNEIKKTSFLFSYEGPMSLDEARSIFVEISQDWLEWINENEDLREYLLVYPFEPENIDIGLMHRNFSEANLDVDCIAGVSVLEDKVHFRIFDPEIKRLKNISIESYSELMSQDSSGHE
ncbi:hypothetical protein SCG7109_AA_00470 [Chlamydiales bacterium SCGC AG-110-M15]|nr:hypothetical protein SCG7109_AA_00470 [Chlamydiales bacterium SCGC AG-110-M15]